MWVAPSQALRSQENTKEKVRPVVMGWQVTGWPHKLDDLILMSAAHVEKKGENRFCKVVFWPPHVCLGACKPPYTYQTHVIIRNESFHRETELSSSLCFLAEDVMWPAASSSRVCFTTMTDGTLGLWVTTNLPSLSQFCCVFCHRNKRSHWCVVLGE